MLTKAGEYLAKLGFPYVSDIPDTDLEFWVNNSEHNPAHLHIRKAGKGGGKRIPKVDLETLNFSPDCFSKFTADERRKIIQEASKFQDKFKQKFERSMSQRQMITQHEANKWAARVPGVKRDPRKMEE